MKNKYIMLKKNKIFHRGNDDINKKKSILISIILVSSFITSIYLIFFRNSKLKAFLKSDTNLKEYSEKNKKGNSAFYPNESLEITKEKNNINFQKQSKELSESKKIFLEHYSLNKLYWNNEISLNVEQVKSEIKNFNRYELSFDNKTDFIKRDNPKVSVVITVYNQEKNIRGIYGSIQKQELKDLEIIFVDDASNDNSSLIIKDLMQLDKRIVYLKNEINKRAFFSRNKAILNSRGEYIIVVDPDDLLLNNILIKAYETAKKYDLDIVQFYAFLGEFKKPILWTSLKNKDGIIKSNSEIRKNFYHKISRNLWDKLVRRETYLKSIKFMKSDFYNELYYINNDDTSFFGLLHVAETYGFLEQIGYFYILRSKGTYNYRNDPDKMNLIIRSIFNNLKYFYVQSDNTTIEKSGLAYKYFNNCYEQLINNIQNVTEGLDFINEVLDLYLNSPYFNHEQKMNLKNVKRIVLIKKKNEKI